MKRKAALFLAALMAIGTAVSVPAAENFADIDDVPWNGAKAYINSAYENGLMVGDINKNGERVFRARDKISYIETAQLVYNLSGDTVDELIVSKWVSDMVKNNIPKWAYNAVSYALENEIISRYDVSAFMNFDGTVRYITRENAAYIFGRFLAKEGARQKAGLKEYTDKYKISAVCQEYVNLLAGLEIMVGDEEGNFNPNNTLNRAEMAVITTKTNNFLNEITETPVEAEKPESDYSGYINNVTDTSIMLYTFDGGSVILDRARDSQFYLDGKEVNTRGIYSLTTNGILVKADIYVNSSDIAMEIYCTRADVDAKVTGLDFKSGEYKRGSRYIPYAFYTVTMTYDNGLSRSYRIDDDTDFMYEDKDIDIEDFQELIKKALPEVDLTDENVIGSGFIPLDIADIDEDEYEEKYLHVYAVADVDFNDEYYVYPQARVKELRLYTVHLEKGIVAALDRGSITVLDEKGKEFEYKIGDGARFYVNGEKERFTDFKKAVRINLSSVDIVYDSDGYIMKLSAQTID